MILRLVDRRGDPPGDAPDWFGAQDRSSLLAALSTGLGGPDWNVDLVLIDDEAMVGLNEGFRGSQGVTDVLSFSYLDNEGSGKPDLSAGVRGAPADLWLEPAPGREPGDREPMVGEIVLAPGFIARRCAEKGWPLEHEMPMLIVHGLLHILGRDHLEEAEAEAMQSVEQEVLSAAGLPHPMRERG